MYIYIYLYIDKNICVLEHHPNVHLLCSQNCHSPPSGPLLSLPCFDQTTELTSQTGRGQLDFSNRTGVGGTTSRDTRRWTLTRPHPGCCLIVFCLWLGRLPSSPLPRALGAGLTFLPLRHLQE